MKRIRAIATAAAMLLSCTAGALPEGFAIPVTAQTSVTAVASTATLDEATGTLTLSGAVVRDDVIAFANNAAVKKVVAAKGTVLPKSCTEMFQKFSAESIDLSNADTSGVQSMARMFYKCTNLTSLNISGFNTASVTNLSRMFNECSKLTEIDVSGFDTSAVTDMYGLFMDCTSLKSMDLSGFDTSQVTTFSNMFYNCAVLETVNLSGLDTSKSESFTSMFSHCVALKELDVSGFDTSSATEMFGMFYNCPLLTELDLTGFDTSKVTNMGYMFRSCHALTSLDLSSFDTSKVESYSEMFRYCRALTTIVASDKWSNESCTRDDSMFQECEKLVGGNGTLYRIGEYDVEYANIDTFEDPGYFTAAGGSTTPPPITDTELDEETGILTLKGEINRTHVALFRGNTAVKKVVAEKGAKFPPDSSDMFYNFDAAESIDISKADTTHVTDMSSMFSNCEALTSVTLKGIDTSRVTDLNGLFYNCTSMTELDLTCIDTSNVSDFGDMFGKCTALTKVNLTGMVTSGAVDLSRMFFRCRALTEVNMSGFDTRYITTMHGMFDECESLTEIDLSHFRTPRLRDMEEMFNGCTALTKVNLTSFDTRMVSSMEAMFAGCASLTEADLSSFIVQNTQLNVSKMFYGCSALKTIYVTDNWNYDNLKVYSSDSGAYVFGGCDALTGGNGTAYSSGNYTVDYFRIDSAETPGYLTLGDGSVQPPEPAFGARLDEETGTLTIFGVFDGENDGSVLGVWKDNEAVKKIVTAEGTVFPKDYSFLSFKMESVEFTQGDFSLRTSLDYFFHSCKNLKSVKLSGIDTANVTDMSYMFSGCTALTDIVFSGIDTSHVTTMHEMCRNCDSLTSIDFLAGLDTSALTDMCEMFYDCDGLTEAVFPAIDTSNVTVVSDLYGMFQSCDSLITADLTAIDASGVTSFKEMFKECPALETVTLAGVKASSLTSTESMFEKCTALKTVSLAGMKTPALTNMSNMFAYCPALESVDLTGLDTSKVERMGRMFNRDEALKELDLSSFSTASLQSAVYMLYSCSGLEKITVSELWDTTDLANTNAMEGMFYGCDKLVGGNGTAYDSNHYNGEYARIDTAEKPGYFTASEGAAVGPTGDCVVFDEENGILYLCGKFVIGDVKPYRRLSKVKKVVAKEGCIMPASCEQLFYSFLAPSYDLSKADFSGVTNMKGMFSYSGLSELNMTGCDTSNVTDMTGLFTSCDSLTEIDLSFLNTSSAKYLSELFKYSDNLETVNLTGIDTTNTWYMDGMFAGCEKLKALDLSGFNTSNCRRMNEMFYDCKSLTELDVTGFNTGTVFNMSDMFRWCSGLTELDVSGFDTRTADDMSGMFAGLSNVTALDVSGFRTAKVDDFSYMFDSCTKLTSLDLTGFDTSEAEKMNCMFRSCEALTKLDLSSFDTVDVKEMESMFCNAKALKTILVSDQWNTDKVTESEDMFADCKALVGGNGTKFSASHTDVGYARVDMPTIPGYLTKGGKSIVSLDEKTGVLTLSGAIVAGEVMGYAGNDTVKKVVALEGTVFPEICSGLFKDFRAASMDLSKADTARTVLMNDMFSGCCNLTSLDISGFNTELVTSMKNMFSGCAALPELNVKNFKTQKVENMANMFSGCASLETLDLYSFFTSVTADMSRMFKDCTKLTGVIFSPLFGLTTIDTDTVESMFENCVSLKEFDMSQCDSISGDYNAKNMFRGCVSLTAVTLPERANLNNMAGMFSGCVKLTKLDFTGVNTVPVTDFSEMFLNCSALTEILVSSKWGTQNASASADMFKGCTALKGGCGTVYDAKHTDAEYARVDSEYAPGYLTNDGSVVVTPPAGSTAVLDETTGILTLSGRLSAADVKAYAGVGGVKRIAAAAGTVLPADCTGLFADSKAEVIDLSKADCSAVTDMTGMFAQCTDLTTVIVSGSWSTDAVTASEGMFTGDTKLTGGNGTKYADDRTDAEYARIDTPDAPGYFTERVVSAGDVNGDESIGTDDAMLLARYVNGWPDISIDPQSADIDGDGVIDTRDAMILARYVNGWSGYDSYFTAAHE
ncbi:MAG: BspA family leucine-rich repeat surface protein [Oscillospiraceae bacterium]|nr:BspA family leucine-rich repeat surface protein [Oscillospiraceae bacterium]